MFQWPEFPAERPTYLRDKLVIALVAYECSVAGRDKAECQMSVRHLEMRFSFSSRSVAEACLQRLMKRVVRKHTGWLEISTPASGAKGHHYRLGHRASPMDDQWVEVGRALFGSGGALEPYRTRPIFRGHGLGPEGCAVLACVERCGPLDMAELIELLSTFVSESTARKKLKLLVTEGLVKCRGDRYYTTRNVAALVERYEHDYDLVDSHIAHHQRLLSQSLAFQVELQGGPDIKTLKSALRKTKCFYCGKRPRPEGETVEHFPPIRWGGSDESSILLPACIGCNLSHGPLIRSFSGDVIDSTVSRLVIDLSPTELRHRLTDAMLIAASNYAAAMNRRDIDEALAIARTPVVSLWAALRRGPGGLVLVNPLTGEAHSSSEDDSSPDVRQSLEGLVGLAQIRTPRPVVEG
jgi:hypothetical protein